MFLTKAVNNKVAKGVSFFITESNNDIVKRLPGLKFQGGGWETGSKMWGLIWKADTSTLKRVDSCLRQSPVKVSSSNGAIINAVRLDHRACPLR